MANSAVDNGNGFLLPVAVKAATVLPPYMAMAWISIERVCVSLHIVAGVALVSGSIIQGRS